MSYSKTLDEYSMADLKTEIARREQAKARGQCDYCGKQSGTRPSCRFPERHGIR